MIINFLIIIQEKMSVIIDFIAGIGVEMVKDKIINQSSSREIQERIRNHLKKQSSLKFFMLCLKRKLILKVFRITFAVR